MDAAVVDAVQQVFVVAALAVANGGVTALLTQALKWRAIAVPAQKYPVPVAIVLSLITSAFVVWAMGSIVLTGIVGWVVFSFATLLVSTQSYDIVKKAIEQIKDEPEY